MLAHLLRAHPAELRADFQRYYNLNLDGMGDDYTIAHAADLAACLPRESRCGIAEDPLNEWTIEARMLAFIEYYAHVWLWAHTKDGKARRNAPKLRMPLPLAKGEQELMDAEELDEFMSGLIGKRESEGEANASE